MNIAEQARLGLQNAKMNGREVVLLVGGNRLRWKRIHNIEWAEGASGDSCVTIDGDLDYYNGVEFTKVTLRIQSIDGVINVRAPLPHDH